jgi:DUF4097 and DUF4098 domain-containing protein YvlB
MIKMALLGTLLASASLTAAERIERTIEARADGRIFIENTAGDVDVMAWDRAEVELIAVPGRYVEEVRVDARDGSIEIEVINEPGRRQIDGTDLTLKVPAGSSIVIEAVSGDIELRGVRGELRVATVSGDIEADVFGGRSELNTTSGDIVATGHGEAGELSLRSTSGDVEVTNLVGELDASTVSGDLSIRDGRLSEVDLNVVSGDIELRGAATADARMNLDTVSGTIDLKVPADFAGYVDATTFNGNIRNCFGPEPERTSRHGPGRKLRFEQGSGSGRLEMSTMSGSIRLCTD